MSEINLAEVIIRPLLASDADAAASLSTQLGYPASAQDILPRIEQASSSSDRALLAATLHNKLAGWADVSIERHLQSPDTAILGGLVVDQTLRSRGIGSRLCQAAEDWARTRGITTFRVRSRVTRPDAHRFYLRDGYELVKTSAVFEKKLL